MDGWQESDASIPRSRQPLSEIEGVDSREERLVLWNFLFPGGGFFLQLKKQEEKK